MWVSLRVGYGVCLWSRAGSTEEFGIVSFRSLDSNLPRLLRWYSGHHVLSPAPAWPLVFCFSIMSKSLTPQGCTSSSTSVVRTSCRSVPWDENHLHDWSWVPGQLETELTREPVGEKGRSSPRDTKQMVSHQWHVIGWRFMGSFSQLKSPG